jgi:hypothetical protein
MTILRCPRCAKATREGVPSDRCIDKQTIGCPAPIAVMTGADVLLQCRTEGCDKMFALPVGSIMARRIPVEVHCERNHCGIVAVTPTQTVPPSHAPTETIQKSGRDKRKPSSE